MDTLDNLALSSLLPPNNLLRLVIKDSIEYLELRDSIQDRGLINAICVRPAANKQGYYEIIDGLNRFECAKDLNLETIPALIKHDVSDDDVLIMQIQAQAIRPETKPADFAKQMRKMLVRNPEMTFIDLARSIRKTPRWIKDHLDLLKLDRATQLSVDRGEIPLQSAYLLARIPFQLRAPFIDKARLMPVSEFRPLAVAALKTYGEAIRRGKLDDFYDADFKPHPHLRSLKEVLDERRQRVIGPMLIAAANAKTPLDGFYAAFDWFVHLDAESIFLQEQRVRARHQKERITQNRDDSCESLSGPTSES